MTRKQFLRMVLFLSVTFCMIFVLFSIFKSNQNTNNTRRWNAFYAEENNSVDAILVGASMVDRNWVSPLAWNNSGITIFPISSAGFPIAAATSAIDEVLKTQSPDLVMIEVHGVRSYSPYARQSDLRNFVDSIHYTSLNRLKAIKKVAAYNEAYEQEFGEVVINNSSPSAAKIDLSDWSYYIPFINYHSRWETGLQKEDFTKAPNKFKGASDMRSRRTATEVQSYPPLTDQSDLSPFFQDVIQEIIDYGEEKNLNMLFIALPTVLSEEEYKEVNGALEVAQNAGLPTLNMNTAECYTDMNLNFDEDFMDSVHLNSKGAVKTTAYITEYIKDNYDIEDKRNNPQYKSWDTAWEDYQVFFEAGWDMSLEDYMSQQ